MPTDLNDIISESIEDAELPPDTSSEPTEAPVEAAPAEPTQDVTPDAPDAPEAPEAASEAPKPPVDDFETKFGIPAHSLSGRENRIPYSRVKKITEKAVIDAKKDWETNATPWVEHVQGQIKDYEERLERVAKFEDVMINRPDQFLDMLSQVPAYQPFFKAIEAAIAQMEGRGQGQPQGQAPAQDQMPEPDQDLSDGTKVYSMEGLKSLLAWQAAQVENKVTKQLEDRYKPLESNYEAQQKWAAQERLHSEVLGKVQGEIAEARTWPQFNENEQDITTALQTYPRLTLEGAYRHVVFPKIVADRNRIREEVMRDVKQAPRSTSAPSGNTKAAPPVLGGNVRNLEDVIADSIKTLK